MSGEGCWRGRADRVGVMDAGAASKALSPEVIDTGHDSNADSRHEQRRAQEIGNGDYGNASEHDGHRLLLFTVDEIPYANRAPEKRGKERFGAEHQWIECTTRNCVSQRIRNPSESTNFLFAAPCAEEYL